MATGLENVRTEIELREERVKTYQSLLKKYSDELEELREQEAALTPPFQPGDLVQYKEWAIGQYHILGCARIAGEWLALVQYDDGDKDALMADELVKVKPPFPREGARWHRKEPGCSGPESDNGTIGSPTSDGFLVHYDCGTVLPLSRWFIERTFEEAA